jgi:hypothetical protein
MGEVIAHQCEVYESMWHEEEIGKQKKANKAS